MDGNTLLDEYISYLKMLEKTLHLNKALYAVKTPDELRYKEPLSDMLPVAEGKNEKDVDSLRSGEVLYYKIYKQDEIFCAVLCKKTSKSFYGNLRTYRAITNSENPEKLDRLLFKNSKLLAIDDAIKKIEELRIVF